MISGETKCETADCCAHYRRIPAKSYWALDTQCTVVQRQGAQSRCKHVPLAQDNGMEGVVRTRVSIDSLAGKAMRLNVRKRPGLEGEDVLGEAEDAAGADDGEPSPQ